MSVSVDHAVDAEALVEQLQPVEDAVVKRCPFSHAGRRQIQRVVDRVNLHHVHKREGARVTFVRLSIAVLVVEHPSGIGMVHLQQLLTAVVPQREPLDLRFEVRPGHRSTAVLSAQLHLDRKGILMIQRQRRTGQFHPRDCRNELPDPQPVDVRLIRADAVVFSAGSELDVLANQIQHAPQLTAGVVPRRSAVTVKVAAHPTGRIDRPDQFGRQVENISRRHVDLGEDRIELGPVTDRDRILARRDLLLDPTVGRVENVPHGELTRLGTEVQLGSLSERLEFHLAGDRIAESIREMSLESSHLSRRVNDETRLIRLNLEALRFAGRLPAVVNARGVLARFQGQLHSVAARRTNTSRRVVAPRQIQPIIVRVSGQVGELNASSREWRIALHQQASRLLGHMKDRLG